MEIQTGNEWTVGRIDSVLREETNPNQGLLLLHTEKGQIILPLSRITALRLPLHPSPELRSPDADPESEQRLQTVLDKKIEYKTLQVNYKLDKAAPNDGSATLSYLSTGLTWIPSYRLILDSASKSAKLHMQSLFMNDADDMFVEELVLVNGFPAFNGPRIPDPLVTQAKIADLQNLSLAAQSASPTSDKPGIQPTDQLFFYRFNNITLRKKARILLPVFSTDAKFTDIYHCDVQEGRLAVWKSIKLENKSSHLWPPGSIMIHKDADFTAHTELPQCIIGDTVLLDLAEDTDIKVSLDTAMGEEVQMSVGQSTYRVVQFTSTIKATNTKSTAVTLTLTRDFSGRISSPIAHATVKTELDEVGMNDWNSVKWEVNLEPQSTIELPYSYKVYKLFSRK